MATKNRSQPISETFEQIVYSSTSVTGYQTNNLVNNSFYYCFLSVFLQYFTAKYPYSSKKCNAFS
jgi:hypothetical protein